jgi:hypothetical protein
MGIGWRGECAEVLGDSVTPGWFVLLDLNLKSPLEDEMIAVAELETHILELPTHEFAKLRTWLLSLDDKRWDAQITNDVQSGKLNHLIANAQAEMATGTARAL